MLNNYQPEIRLKTSQLTYYIFLPHCSTQLKIIQDSTADQKIRQDQGKTKEKLSLPRWIWEIDLAFCGKPITPVLTSHLDRGSAPGFRFPPKIPFLRLDSRVFWGCPAKSPLLFGQISLFIPFPLAANKSQMLGGGEMYGPNFTAKRVKIVGITAKSCVLL